MRAVAAALRVEEREERLVHAARARVALGGGPGHRLAEDGDELRRGVAAEELDRRVLARLHAAHRLERARRGERVDPGDALVEQRAEREEVAARVDGLAARLLGAHVPELALEHLLGRGLVDRAARLGDAEVGDLDLALEREEHVLRRHVAVDDAERAHVLVAPAVRVVEALGDLGRDVRAHLHGEGGVLPAGARERAREVEPVHVLHRDVERVGRRARLSDVGGLAEIEDLHHVRVREAHGELGLVDEHVDELGAARELGQDALDDEDLLEALDAVALGLEDLRHAALAQPLQQAVATECGVHGAEIPPATLPPPGGAGEASRGEAERVQGVRARGRRPRAAPWPVALRRRPDRGEAAWGGGPRRPGC